MFFAAFQTIDHAPQAGIYADTPGGYAAYHRDTWSPETEIITCFRLNVSGRSYQDRKRDLYEKALEYSSAAAQVNLSYGELATLQNFFENAGRKYGLIREFRENAIC